MAIPVQVTIDCANPDRLAHFWAALLGYKLQDPPEGYSTWEEALNAFGVPEEEWESASAVVDPEGRGPRIFFQRVPEPKSVKNRLHLDVNVGTQAPPDAVRAHVDAEVQRAIELGATRINAIERPDGYWVVMQDPEGNEFCLQ